MWIGSQDNELMLVCSVELYALTTKCKTSYFIPNAKGIRS